MPSIHCCFFVYPSFEAEIDCNPRVSRPTPHRNLTSGTQRMFTQECVTQEFCDSQNTPRGNVTLVMMTEGKNKLIHGHSAGQ